MNSVDMMCHDWKFYHELKMCEIVIIRYENVFHRVRKKVFTDEHISIIIQNLLSGNYE